MHDILVVDNCGLEQGTVHERIEALPPNIFWLYTICNVVSLYEIMSNPHLNNPFLVKQVVSRKYRTEGKALPLLW